MAGQILEDGVLVGAGADLREVAAGGGERVGLVQEAGIEAGQSLVAREKWTQIHWQIQ